MALGLGAGPATRVQPTFLLPLFTGVRGIEILGSSGGPQPYRGGPTNSESYFWFISSTVLPRPVLRFVSSPCSVK